MHDTVKQWLDQVKSKYPLYFSSKDVIIHDIGSLDINGCNKPYFNGEYVGFDIQPGKNVDVVKLYHMYGSDKQVSVIVSTECFEHDKYLQYTLSTVVSRLMYCGLFVFTCASTGRPEHGTTEHEPSSSPSTNDFYCNRTVKDFKFILPYFKEYEFDVSGTDLRFYGIRNDKI